MEEIIFERKVLYEKVWTKPITHIADEYSIPVSAVYKACKKLDIPTPKGGHWSKIKYNKVTTVWPLPEIDANFTSTCIIVKKEQRFKRTIERVKNTIKVPKALKNPHPLVQATLDRHAGKYDPRKEDLFINVTDSTRLRALRIIDTIIKVLENEKCSVSSRGSRQMFVIKAGIDISFSLYERKKRYENKVSKGWWDKYEYIQDGTLVLSINEWLENTRIKRKYFDNDKYRLEDLLEEFVYNIKQAIEFKRQLHDKWAAQRKEIERLQQLKIEQETKERLIKEELGSKIRQLEYFSESYHKFNLMMSFIEQVKKRYLYNSENTTVANNWIKWAEEYAGSLHPFSSNKFIDYIKNYSIKLDEPDIPAH